MSFDVLVVRTGDADDPTMYPLIGDQPNTVLFDRADGQDVKTVTATAVTVTDVTGKRSREIAKVSDVRATVFITESRVAIACSKYDKGGGWMGTSLAVPFLNLASHACAAVRRRGKMLVGQVRYPWVAEVGSTAKTSWLTDETVRIALIDTSTGSMRTLLVDLTLPKSIDAAAVAADIARRTARFRLTHDGELTGEERFRFNELCGALPLASAPKRFAFHSMPTYFHANPRTATPRRRVSEAV